MTAVALTALGIVGLQVVYSFYLSRKKDKAHDQALMAVRVNAQLLVQADELEDGVATRDTTIETLTTELEAEKAARWKVEEQRDALLTRLAENGDAHAVADAIRAELSALSELSEVPRAPADPGEGGRGRAEYPSPVRTCCP